MFTTLTAVDGTLLHAFWKGPLSNWEQRPILIDGTLYANGEQRIMVAKAELFGDSVRRNAMLKTSDPETIKRLGKAVSGFKQALWDAMRPVISRDTLLHKIAQHDDIFQAIRSSPEGRFVEASPYDKIWGIGLGVHHPDVRDPAKWQGQNLLGQDYDAVSAIIG